MLTPSAASLGLPWATPAGEPVLLMALVVGGLLLAGALAWLAALWGRDASCFWLGSLLWSMSGIELLRGPWWGSYDWPLQSLAPTQLLAVLMGCAGLALCKLVSLNLALWQTLPLGHRVLWGLCGLHVAVALMSLLTPEYGFDLLVLTTLALTAATPALGLLAWRRGHSGARTFCLAFSLALLAESWRLLAHLQLLPWSPLMSFSLAGFVLATPLILHKLLGQTLHLSQTLAQHRARDQARIEFMARIGHELRAPLSAIIGFARMLRRGSARLPVEEGALGIEQHGQRLLTLIEELLDETRLATGRLALAPQPVRLQPWLEALRLSAELSTSTAGNRLIWQLEGSLPETLEFDGKRLQQVLENLLSNANRHTSDGEITLRCTASPDPAAGQCRLHFSVQDTGSGIRPEDLGRLFEPFFVRNPPQLRQNPLLRPGLGLGLPIAHELLQLMHSELQVSSQLGQGSRFSFTITCPIIQLNEPVADEMGDSLPLPDDDALDTLRALVRDGEVTGIEAWCDTLAERSPELAPFAQQIRQACHRLDFAALERLAAGRSAAGDVA